MSSSTPIVLRRECKGCQHQACYDMSHKYPYHCYNRARKAGGGGKNPPIRSTNLEITRTTKPCPLLKKEVT